MYNKIQVKIIFLVNAVVMMVSFSCEKPKAIQPPESQPTYGQSDDAKLGSGATEKKSLASQCAFVQSNGFLSSPGKALDNYLSAFNLLKEQNGDLAKLRIAYLDNCSVSDGDFKIFEKVCETVMRGAKKRIAGVPDILWYQGNFTIDFVAYPTTAFMFPGYACMIAARHKASCGDYQGAITILKGVMAMGLQLTETKDESKIVLVTGMACKEYALKEIQHIAASSGDKKLATACETMIHEVQKERRNLRNTENSCTTTRSGTTIRSLSE